MFENAMIAVVGIFLVLALFRSVAIVLLPDSIAGPGGWLFDTDGDGETSDGWFFGDDGGGDGGD